MPTLYATVDDLRLALEGTDGGTGTPAQLTDAQLTLALQSASNRVSVYFGSVMDGTNPQANPPDIFHDLTLDLASFWAWKTYLKGKAIPNTHPAFIAYQNATQMLNDVRDGKIRLDPADSGGVNSEVGYVVNRIPPVFNGHDSNTRLDPQTGYLESDTPYDQWRAGGGLLDDMGGAVYQG